MQKIKTGDIGQIRRNGRNYLILGKSIDNRNETKVLLVKNGVVRQDGQVRDLPRGRRPRVWVVKPSQISRIHGHRHIDIDSVREKIPNAARVLIRMDAANGVNTTIPNIGDVVASVNALNVNT